jgi:hypothetical protein
MIEELLRRRQEFQPGRKICLADGQSWTFPSPLVTDDPKGFQAALEYGPLLDALREADSESERALAELALAVFLLDWNYNLSPSEYQKLLSFPPDSPAVEEWRENLDGLARSHLRAAPDFDGRIVAKAVTSPSQSWLTRLLTRLRPSPTDR